MIGGKKYEYELYRDREKHWRRAGKYAKRGGAAILIAAFLVYKFW